MQKLNKAYKGKLSLAIEIFKGTYKKKFLHQLVSSQLDMDRLDYLARDSFFSGVAEGTVGYERIIKMLTVVNNELVVEEKGMLSIEKFLISRRFMYWQVYLHKTVLSSEIMLVKILERAVEIFKKDTHLFCTPALHFFLQKKYSLNDFKNNEQCLIQYLSLDDSDIMSAVKVWSKHQDPILSDLCTRLANRDLFKVKFITSKKDQEIAKIKKTIKQQLKISEKDLKYYFIQNVTSNKTYEDNGQHIKILHKNGLLKKISTVENSLIHTELLVPTKKHYICFLRN